MLSFGFWNFPGIWDLELGLSQTRGIYAKRLASATTATFAFAAATGLDGFL